MHRQQGLVEAGLEGGIAALGKPLVAVVVLHQLVQPLITHRSVVKPPCDGSQLLRDPMYNKGAAFSHEEREHLLSKSGDLVENLAASGSPRTTWTVLRPSSATPPRRTYG